MQNRIATPFCYRLLAETQHQKAQVGVIAHRSTSGVEFYTLNHPNYHQHFAARCRKPTKATKRLNLLLA